MKELFEDRALLYGFLARIYRKEADAELLNSVKSFDYSQFPEGEGGDVNAGFLMMQKVAKRIASSTLLDLARDYARVFLGAGLAKNEAAFPYESYYTSPDRLLMQDARDEVMFFYGAEMLKRSDDFTEHEDHIAFEFEFMAYLCVKSIEAIENGDKEQSALYLQKQKDFFGKHIDRWVNMFCNDVLKTARHDFYKAAAVITKGLLAEEREFFKQA